MSSSALVNLADGEIDRSGEAAERRVAARDGLAGRGVVGHVVQVIREGILDGRLAPGHRLVEADLTRSLNVSRSTVREALNKLAADGLVQVEANRGAAVARTTRRHMRDMFLVRELLEGQAARQVAERATLADVRRELERLRQIERTRDLAQGALDFMAANNAFHDVILGLSDNEVLGRMVPQLQLPQFRAAFFRFFTPGVSEQSAHDHLAIIDAALARDADMAEMLMRRHVRRTGELVRTMPDDIFAT